MRILVDGTTVTAWGDAEGVGIPFDVDDFPGVQEGMVLHWDGIRWWYELDYAEPFEVLSALMQDTDALDELPDAVLARMAPYMAEWEADRAYRLGDKVQYLDRPYRVLQDHTSHEAYPPDTAVSLYARILAGGGDDYPVWEQPDSTNPYMRGDRVHYPDKDGPVYESTIDNNVFSPKVYPAGWQLVEGAA